MFCSKCGKEIPEGSAFCNGCGAPFNAAGANASPAPEPNVVNLKLTETDSATFASISMEGGIIVVSNYFVSTNGSKPKKCKEQRAFPISELTDAECDVKKKPIWIVVSIICIILAVVSGVCLYNKVGVVEGEVALENFYLIATVALGLYGFFGFFNYVLKADYILKLTRGNEVMTLVFRVCLSSRKCIKGARKSA